MALLQIAVDTLSLEEMLALAEKLGDAVDIYEVGTPAIMRDGMLPVRLLKEKHPGMTVLADAKIVDGGRLECEDACRAGADIVTVLAVSDDATISAVAETAHRYGRKAMADLISVSDIARRAPELLKLGVDYVCVHTGVDVQARGVTPLDQLRTLCGAIPSERAAVAGGIRPDTLADYLAQKPAIIIMGGALCGAADPRAAALDVKRAIG